MTRPEIFESSSCDGKVAVVTGASKGIGRQIALTLASVGFKIAVNYLEDEQGAQETADKVRESGVEALVVRADVGVRSQVDQMFNVILDRLGGPYALVNNAGVQTWKPLLALTEEEWDRTVRTNLKGTFLCTQRAGRYMTQMGCGKIINIGSGCNKIPFPNLVDYTSTKGGIEMFTRVAAVELGPYGITVNCIAPGAIKIERTETEAPNYAATWSSITPMRRVGNPDDVSRAVAFLISKSGDFITGQTLYIDGGVFSQGPWPYPIKRAEI